MGKCIKSIVLSVVAAVFGVLALSGPVFATPNNANDNTDSSITTDDPTDATSTDDQANTTDNTEENTGNVEENSETTESTTSCYDQVGSLGWIICPGAGLFGTIIDGAYNILTNFIETDPLPAEQDSPIYITWEYFKNITNSIFIIFFMIIILSQLTGYGMNNYSIKKALPRIVIAAILANLSYVICILAVDVSNILGNGLYAFFTNIQNTAIESGAISSAASSASVSAIIASLIGVGAAGATVFAAAVALGSVEGIIWLLLPILFSGVIAIATAVVTMAARQALIFILVIIAPLAIIAYMLPNTEKYAKKWFSTLFQMLIFYPSFAVLYGASQLAGMIIITSATSWLTIVLGVAVKLLPLFLSIPLMRMSGSVLGKISGVMDRVSNPARRGIGTFAAEQSKVAKSKQAAGVGRFRNMPSARLARYLDRKRVQREMDAKEYNDLANKRNATISMERYKNRNGKYNSRGLQHYQNILTDMELNNRLANIENDFDEGFDVNDKRVRKSDRKRVAKINRGYDKAIVGNAAVTSRKQAVSLANMEHRADLIQQNVEKEGTAIHKQVLAAFNVDSSALSAVNKKKEAWDDANYKQTLLTKRANGSELSDSETNWLKDHGGSTLTATEQNVLRNGALTANENKLFNSGQRAINTTLSNAITAKRKVDREARSNYIELYDNYEAGPRIKQQLIRAFETKDYNSMSAALEIMYKRGDKDDIGKVLRDYSHLVKTDADIRFQKELNDICLSFKAEDLDIAQWAKANMMRRGMSGKGKDIAHFIDYASWAKGITLDEDKDLKAARKTSRIELGEALSSWEAIATADRTMWNQILEDQQAGLVPQNGKKEVKLQVFPIKYLRSAVCSGRMDGERLESFNKFFTGGLKVTYDEDGVADWEATENDKENKFFYQNQKLYEANIIEFLRDMTAPQLATLKTATIKRFNEAMLAYHPDDYYTIDGEKVSRAIYDAVATQREQLNTEKSMASQRTGMNPAVRKMLGIDN